MKYNDGTAIEPEKLNLTTRELSQRFGGVSQDLVHVHGLCRLRMKRIETADSPPSSIVLM